MPHIVIEFSAGLEQSHDMNALCGAVFDAAAATGVFPDIPSIKVRARPVSYFLLGSDPQSFAHADVGLLDGRTVDQKSAVTQAVLQAMDGHLPDVGSLTVDIHDMVRATYAKRTL
jgi:5-carboxymethyl-2-hydroxymuconate isomerase